MFFQLLIIFGIMAVLIFGSSYIYREYYKATISEMIVLVQFIIVVPQTFFRMLKISLERFSSFII